LAVRNMISAESGGPDLTWQRELASASPLTRRWWQARREESPVDQFQISSPLITAFHVGLCKGEGQRGDNYARIRRCLHRGRIIIAEPIQNPER